MKYSKGQAKTKPANARASFAMPFSFLEDNMTNTNFSQDFSALSDGAFCAAFSTEGRAVLAECIRRMEILEMGLENPERNPEPFRGGITLGDLLRRLPKEDQNFRVIEFFCDYCEFLMELAQEQWESLMGASPSASSSWNEDAVSALRARQLAKIGKDFSETTGEQVHRVINAQVIQDIWGYYWEKEPSQMLSWGGKWETDHRRAYPLCMGYNW